MKVSVQDAKNRLSELIRAAQAGEEVIIANRGQAGVRLSPIQEPMNGAGVGSAKALLNWLEKSSQSGWKQRNAADINADIEQERGAWD